MRRILMLAAVLALISTACSVSFGTKPSSSASPELSQAAGQLTGDATGSVRGVSNVVARVLPAVVNVTSTLPQGKGVGTGFIVRSDGVVVTNCHVVEDATKLTVFSSAKDPQQYDAHVIGGDCLHDLAVLKIDASGLATVPLGSSAALRLGQPVVALGYALALEGGPTVTEGIVSSLDRTIQVADPGCSQATCGQRQSRTYSNVIQTDAAINHGNSGGPLVNLQGQVVGINSAGNDSAQNIGFAISIDAAKDTISKAETDPLAPTGYLGVSVQDVTPPLAYQFGLKVKQGVYVVAAAADGPAGGAGIVQGDVIVSVNGQDVTSTTDLGTVLDGLKPGTAVSVGIVTKDGTQQTINVSLGARPLPVDLP